MLSCRLLGPYTALENVENMGLGNQLFLYALTRTVAERKGYNFFINSHQWQAHKLFNVDLGKTDGVIDKVFEDNYEVSFNPMAFNVDDFTLFNGYFHSEKYFDHDKVRQWFKPKIDIVTPYSFEDYCFIHYRAGDYSLPPWDSIQLPISYYKKAKDEMLKIKPSLRFVVVTNDWHEAANRFPDDRIVSGTTEEDFTLLTNAKYLIISNSSFSWWVAWLNPDNTVIAPQGWFNYNKNKQEFSPMDIKVERFIWIE